MIVICSVFCCVCAQALDFPPIFCSYLLLYSVLCIACLFLFVGNVCVQAEVKYDAQVLSFDEIARGVSELGYKCDHMRTVGPTSGGGGAESREATALEIEVTGMSCTSCSGKV